MFDANTLLSLADIVHSQMSPDFVPDVTPVSMRTVDMSPPMAMDQHMSDACPQCGAFKMLVGDYVCWGVCGTCYDIEMRELEG